MSRRLTYFVLALGVATLDQVTKTIVIAKIPLHQTIPVIRGFFDLTHLRNTGAAFGVLASAGSARPLLVTLLAFVVLAGVLAWSLSAPPEHRLLQAALALIMGGAVGNLIDRVRFQSVTDFLRFYVDRWEWPSFNVADSAISVGVALLAWDLWKRPESEPPQPAARA
ncbi:MAG: signal peptidase II [Thermoanaerobaculia bacterium]